MSTNIQFIEGLLQLKNVKDDYNEEIRVFIPSEKINIFPCSRRGQFGIETVNAEGKPITVKANGDPEARLNTERTNRLRTSINGFTDSFISSFTKNKDENGNELEAGTLIFALAGYRIEIKEFNPIAIATALDITNGAIYAHLSLHDGIPFGVANYYTEILYRQSTNAVNNYIDVEYTNGSTKSDFFMGVSFTSYEAVDTIVVNDATKQLKEANLPLFSKSGDTWKLIEASKLPKVEHDTEPDSIKLSGNFTVKHGEQTSFKVTRDETVLGQTVMSSLIVGEKTDGDEFLDGTIRAKNNINVGNPDNPATDATSGYIVAEKDITAEHDLIAKTNAKVEKDLTVNYHTKTTTLEATESIKTPALDVKSIANKVDTTGVNINDNLNVATGHAAAVDTVNVNTINSRQENGTITVESRVTLNGNATLNNGLEVTNGDTSLKKLTTTELAVATDALTVTKDEAKFTKPVTVDNSLTANNIQANNIQIKEKGPVPALELAHLTKTDTYQVRFKFGAPIKIIEE